MNTDPIADYLTRIRNGIMAGHDAVVIPSSRMKERLSAILKQEGYIHGYKSVEHEGRKYLIINVKYVKAGEPVIHGLKRVSSPGLRVYAGVKEIPEVHGGLGIAILTTPKGLLTGKEAKQQNLGGEILAHVW
jgi:small subunit ribosomal protein S8